MSSRKAGAVLKLNTTTTSKRITFTAGRVGTKPKASQPICSWHKKGQGREVEVALAGFGQICCQ